MEFIHNFLLFFGIYTIIWAIFTTIEQTFPDKKNQPIFSKHLKTEVINALVNSSLVKPLNITIGIFLVDYILRPFFPYQIFDEIINIYLPFYAQIIVGIILMDFIQYIRHRFTHAFLWNYHTTHHSAVEMRSTVHFRMHPVDYIVSHVFNIVILYIIGFSGEAIIFSHFIASINNMWLHTNVNISYPFFLKYILVSPNYHKWHHSKTTDAVDKNFSDFMVLFDYLGGTYYYPQDKNPKEYGVLGVATNNPLYNSFSGAFLYPFKKIKEKRTKKATP